MAKKPAPPPIILGKTDADRLADLATRLETSNEALADLLMGEIERADVREDKDVPAKIVRMHSIVEFVDEAHGAARSIQLVYPSEADIAADRVSVLTPVGAGLIGLAPGQTIVWPDREGRTRRLRIVSVQNPIPETGGPDATVKVTFSGRNGR